MAHGLKTEKSMAYAGAVPWHGLGQYVGEEPLVSADMMEAARLNWTVAMGPLYGGPNKRSAQVVPDLYAIYREDNGAVLGTASKRYQLFQNFEAFEFLDGLVLDGRIRYNTAGALGDGERIWALAQLERGMRVGDDRYVQYMLITTSHNTKGSIKILPTTVRVVCGNTLSMAVAGAQESGDELFYSIDHLPKMHERLAEASEALRITTAANRRLAEFLRQTADAEVSAKREQAVIDEVFGEITQDSTGQQRGRIERFRDALTEEQARVGKTAYALVNAITGYGDHMIQYNGDEDAKAERRFASTAFGEASKFKANAIEVVKQQVPALV